MRDTDSSDELVDQLQYFDKEADIAKMCKAIKQEQKKEGCRDRKKAKRSYKDKDARRRDLKESRWQ